MAPPTPAPRTPPLPWPPVPADDGPTGPAIRVMPAQRGALGPNPPSANPSALAPTAPPAPGPDPALQHTAPYRPLDPGPLAPAPGFGNGWEPLPPRIDTGPAPGHDRRRTAVVAAALALVLLAGAAVVAGVVLSGESAQDAPPTGEAAGTPPVGGDLADGATVVDGAAFGTDPLLFRSPTGNIACVLGSDGVRCDVTEQEWQLPPAPADCTLGWGAGLSLSGTAPGGPTCGGGMVADPSATPLDYGQALRNGDVTCVSRRTGVECRNAVTGHGFAAARASYEAD